MNESIGKIDKSQILLRLTSGKSSAPPRSGGSVPAKPQSGG
jgi:hypothetical protein